MTGPTTDRGPGSSVSAAIRLILTVLTVPIEVAVAHERDVAEFGGEK